MVRVKVRTRSMVPSNGNKKGAQQPEGQIAKPVPEKEKGILQRMLEIISDDIHGKDRKIMLESDESWNDWKGQL